MKIILYIFFIFFVSPRLASSVAVVGHSNPEQHLDRLQARSASDDGDNLTVPGFHLHQEPTIPGFTFTSPVKEKRSPTFELPRKSGTIKFRRPRTRIHSFDNSETIRIRVTSTLTDTTIPTPATGSSSGATIRDGTDTAIFIDVPELQSKEEVAAVVAKEIAAEGEESTAKDAVVITVAKEQASELDWYIQDPVWYVQDVPEPAAAAPPPSHPQKPHGHRDPKIWWSTGLGCLGQLFRPKPKHLPAATTTKPDYQPVLIDEEYGSNGNVLMKVYFILAVLMVCYCAFATTRNRNRHISTRSWRRKPLHDVEKAHYYDHTSPPIMTTIAAAGVMDSSNGYHWIQHNFHPDENGNIVCYEEETEAQADIAQLGTCGITLVDDSPPDFSTRMGQRRWTYASDSNTDTIGLANKKKGGYGVLGKSNSLRLHKVVGSGGSSIDGGRRRAVTWSKGGEGDELD